MLLDDFLGIGMMIAFFYCIGASSEWWFLGGLPVWIPFNSFWHFCECEIVGINADFYSAYSYNKENENGGSPFQLFTE